MKDFDRNVWCILGLPVDVMSDTQATEFLLNSVQNGTGCFLSTPNLNFLITAQDDDSFRGSVIRSDMSLIDGTPLLWMARILGITDAVKVSGSDLFNNLLQKSFPDGRKLSVFFFGGEEGVARNACKRVNSISAGLNCVGSLNPGFGSIDEISHPRIITQINASKADFLVVSLGARKGQLWIDQNRKQLKTPLVSHLGAVVNFTAGTVKRAPLWMRRTGLEWTWRIFQEPALWIRYLSDGSGFIVLFLTRMMPYVFWRKFHVDQLADSKPVACNIETDRNWVIVTIKGNCVQGTIAPVRVAFREALLQSKLIKLDLSNVPLVDGAFVGLCLVLSKQVNLSGGQLVIVGLNMDLQRIFRWNCVEYLL